MLKVKDSLKCFAGSLPRRLFTKCCQKHGHQEKTFSDKILWLRMSRVTARQTTFFREIGTIPLKNFPLDPRVTGGPLFCHLKKYSMPGDL